MTGKLVWSLGLFLFLLWSGIHGAIVLLVITDGFVFGWNFFSFFPFGSKTSYIVTHNYLMIVCKEYLFLFLFFKAPSISYVIFRFGGESGCYEKCQIEKDETKICTARSWVLRVSLTTTTNKTTQWNFIGRREPKDGNLFEEILIVISYKMRLILVLCPSDIYKIIWE